MILEKDLIQLYIVEKLSAAAIAKKLECSATKVNYWLDKYFIQKRTISDAMYILHNPLGDPFTIRNISAKNDYFLLGLGLGLYWGEGTKRNKNGIRLGNSDPALIKSFLTFLETIYGVSRKDVTFGLQVFDTCDVVKTLLFWRKYLEVEDNKFYKTMVKGKRGEGTYKHLVEYGVLTIYFNNTKLRNIMVGNIEKMRKMDIMSSVLLEQLNKPM
ncbi:MAG: hypothetical protein ACOYMZ_03140 [Minisyncoccia bacterium]